MIFDFKFSLAFTNLVSTQQNFIISINKFPSNRLILFSRNFLQTFKFFRPSIIFRIFDYYSISIFPNQSFFIVQILADFLILLIHWESIFDTSSNIYINVIGFPFLDHENRWKFFFYWLSETFSFNSFDT
jgi:hypothetical protein